MKTKPPTKPVTVFACGACGHHFDTKPEADAHCVCKCGRVIEKKERHQDFSSDERCALCRSREHLNYSTRRVSELEKSLEEARRKNEVLRAEHEKLKVEAR
jgi:hypothetical protein